MPQTTKYRHRSPSPDPYPRAWRKSASYPSGEASPLRISNKDRCGSLKVVFTLPKKQRVTAPEQALFQKLVSQWRKETAHHSILTKKVMHPAYQRIIGMGPSAIPLILREMKSRPGHWFWALDALTQGEASPAAGSNNLDEATEAWLAWGRAKRYL
jgi:ribosomal protein L32E